MATPLHPQPAVGTIPTGLLGRLAQLLKHHHADHLLAALLTLLSPHVAEVTAERPVDAAPVLIDVVLVRQLHRLLKRGGNVDLLDEVLTEVEPFIPAGPKVPIVMPADGDLTEREYEILVAASLGLDNAAIGRQLYLGVDTVKTYLRRVYRKFGVHDRAHAVRRAYELGYLSATSRAVA